MTKTQDTTLKNNEGELGCWIIPKNLHISNCAPVTLEYISDLEEQSEICGQSLFVRSKPTQPRIWLRKWKKESWTQLLSGRILKPFLGVALGDEWVSSLGGSRVSHSVRQESGPETKTRGTCSLTYCGELLSADRESCSLKTSKVSCQPSCPATDGVTQPERPFCSMSLESWKEWVTQVRQECSARKKSAHLTVEIESSSSAWTTPNQLDWKDSFNQTNERADGRMKIDQLPRQVFHEAGGLQDRDKSSSTGSRQESWATPQNRDWKNPDPVNDRWTDPSRTKGLPEQLVHLEKWPTPNMPSGGPLKDGSAIVGMNGGPGHREVIKKHFGAGARLNPDWVCCLMGIPVGWVSVNDEGKNRIDELRLLGNGVVPQTAEKAFCHLTQEIINGNV